MSRIINSRVTQENSHTDLTDYTEDSCLAGNINLTQNSQNTQKHASLTRVYLRDVLDRRTEEQVYFLSHADNAMSKSYSFRLRLRFRFRLRRDIVASFNSKL